MLVAFVCTLFAAQAQTVVTDLSQLSNDKVYTLRSARAFLLYSTSVSGKLCSSNASSIGSVEYSLTDPNLQFRIEKSGDNYYLFSEGAQMYVSSDGSYVAKGAAAVLTLDKAEGSYPWKLAVGGNELNTQNKGQFAEGISVSNWDKPDEGNCYQITEATAKAKTYSVIVLGAEGGVTFEGEQYQNGATFETNKPIKKSSFTATPVDGKIAVVSIDGLNVYVSYMDAATKFYTIRGGHGGYVSLGEGYTDGGNLLLTKTDAPKDNKGLWTFVPGNDGSYTIYNYSTGLSKELGFTGEDANARASMVVPNAEGYATAFEGSLNFNGDASYIKSKGTTKWWNKRGDYLAYWNWGNVTGDQGSMFYLEEAEYVSYPDEYLHEITELKGVSAYQPKNPNTLWYTTSAEATGVSYPWMEYALPLGNGELGCMVFGGVANEELQFNEKTLWSGPANTVGAGGGNRTFMNFGSLIIANKDASIWDGGVTDYVRYLDIEEGISGVEFKNANGTKQTRKYFSSAPDQVIAGQYKSEGDDKMELVFSLEPGSGINASQVMYEGNTASFSGAMTVTF